LDCEIAAAAAFVDLEVIAAAWSAPRVTYFFASRTSSSITVWNVKKYVAPERQTPSMQL